MKSFLEFITEARQKEVQQKKEGICILDQINSKDNISQEEIKDQIENLAKVDGAFKPNGPVIYCFITDKVKDAIKIGYTDQHPEKRIEQWKEIYGKDEGEVQCLGYWSSEVVDSTGEKVFFWDHAVHKIVTNDSRYGYENIKKDKSTGTFFLDDLTDKGKDKLKEIKLHYSKEFFRKFAKLNPEKKAELNEVLLEKILTEMKQQILDKKAQFTIYHFTKEGKQEGRKADIAWGTPQSYNNTDLQQDAIDTALDMINGKNGYEKKNHLLMAAVMRFGKTHTAYEIVNQVDSIHRVIVVSAKADVREAWREDINHKHFYKNFVFIEINDKYKWSISTYHEDQNSIVTSEKNIDDPLKVEELYANKKIIYFFSLQDLAGNLKKTKTKHEHIFNTKFDMMIVDETHYGSHANSFGQIAGLKPEEIEDTDIEDAKKELEDSEKLTKEIQNNLRLKYNISLQVSGTPYYILASNEMLDPKAGIITKVSFTDMLHARDKWNKENAKKDPDDKDPNKRRKKDWESPYFGIPNLRKIGLSLTDECRKIIANEGYTSSMTVLFQTNDKGKFVYEKAIQHMMKAIFGDGKGNTLAFMKNKSIEGNKICKHTIVVLPRIKACAAMEELLNDMVKGGDRDILNLTNGKIADVKELNDRLDDIEEKNRKSIILTVNRMLTGTSMPLVDSMIFMKNASSPQEYDQNIFRLCTRNVKKVNAVEEDENGNKKEVKKMVNMKDNVYLIDFNIDNTLQMMANSAKMKAMADIHDGSKEPITDLIEKYMKEDAEAIPLWGEGADDVLGKMQQISPDNLMKVYTKYNQNKSINEIVNSEVDAFKGLFWDVNFQDAIRNINVPDDNGKSIIVPPAKQNQQDIEIKGDKGLSNFAKNELEKNRKKKEVDKEAQAIAEAARRKFIALSKKILYLNICLDEPYDDFDKLLNDVGYNKVLDELIDNFDIDIDDVKKVYKTMKTGFKAGFNAIFTRIKLFFEKGDKNLKPIDKFNKSVEGLGKVAKNEVITPDEIVDKMIDKLDESEYKNAESILLVNEKKGEFLQGLIRKFGKNIAKKCKVVPSSMIGKQLTSKMLKTQGLNDYIKNIIVPMEDFNNDKKIDVKDLLYMKDNDLERLTGKKHFNICLMNPPYAGSLHLDFLERTIKIADKVISVQPCGFLELPESNNYNKYKETIIDKINDIDVIQMTTARDKFNININEDLMIVICKHNNDKTVSILSDEYYSIIKKIMPYVKEHKFSDLEEFDKIDGHRVKSGQFKSVTFGGKGANSESRMQPCIVVDQRGPYLDGYNEGDDPKYKGKWFKDCYAKGGPSNSKKYEGLTVSIKFDTRQEAINFQKSCNNDFFYNWVWLLMTKKYAIVPPTFDKVWTNEDYCKYFKLNEKESELMCMHIDDYRQKKPFVKNYIDL